MASLNLYSFSAMETSRMAAAQPSLLPLSSRSQNQGTGLDARLAHVSIKPPLSWAANLIRAAPLQNATPVERIWVGNSSGK